MVLSASVLIVGMLVPAGERGTAQALIVAAMLLRVCICFDFGGSVRRSTMPPGTELACVCLYRLKQRLLDGANDQAHWL